MSSGAWLSVAVWCGIAGAAGDDQRAKEELEAQLHQMVRIPPAQLEVVFSGIDAADYQLEGATFTLDGAALSSPTAGLSPGTVLFSGTIAPGPHSFGAQVTYREAPNTIFTYMSGTKFKVPSRMEFVAQRGLRLHLRAGIHVDNAAELKGRLKPANRMDPEMLTQVDDGSMPEPMAKLHLPEPDAGAAVAEASAGGATSPNEAEPEAGPGSKKRGSHRTGAGGSHSKRGPGGTAIAAMEPVEEPSHPLAEEKPTAATPPAAEPATPDPGPGRVAIAPSPEPEVTTVTPPPDIGLLSTWSPAAKLGLAVGLGVLALVVLVVAMRKRKPPTDI